MSSSDDLLNMDKWNNYWNQLDIKWHRSAASPLLLANYDLMTNGRSNLRFLLPLCGKTVDLKWLYDQGHTVVGVEGVEDGIKDYWRESGLTYTVEDIPGMDGKVYVTKDRRLKIYHCNFFQFDICLNEEKFDCVWDRAAFVAIGPEARARYRDVVIGLMKPNWDCIMETYDYMPAYAKGPPYHVTRQILQEVYGEWCNICDLQYLPVEASSHHYKKAEKVFYKVYHLMHKSTPVVSEMSSKLS